MKSINRRQLLSAMGLVALGGTVSGLPAAAQEINRSSAGRFFDVKSYGATGQGTILDTAAINRAIDDCTSTGGGMVYVPPGIYLCGTVVLKSNVTVYLEAGATLLGSKNLSDYTQQTLTVDKTAPEKNPAEPDLKDTGPRHLIFARDAENISLTGPGKIDGQGAAFWQPSGRVQPPPEDGWRDVIAFDWKKLPRPSPMVEFYNCKNVHIENVRLENSPGWTLRPVHCDHVFIHGITIKNPVYGPNTDGIDLMCCQNVFISDCVIDTGDDAICLKSENPYGEELRVSKNITVTNCVLSGCCNGFKIGTETHGGFENIIFTDSVIFNDDVPLNSRLISGIALEMVDGGSIDGVLISNIRMQRVRTPIFIRLGNRTGHPEHSPGKLRNVRIENVQAAESILTSSITGLAGFDVEDVSLSGIRIESLEAGKVEWMNRTIPDMVRAYPETRMFGRLPGYGLYCRHVKGLRLNQIEFTAAAGEARPALFCDDVKNLEVTGLRSEPITGSQPVVKLIQSKKVFISGCVAPEGMETFLEVQGGETERIVVTGNDFSGLKTPVQTGTDVSAKAVSASGNVTG